MVKSRIVIPVYILRPSEAINGGMENGFPAPGKQGSLGADPTGDLGMTLTQPCICFLPSTFLGHDCLGGRDVHAEPQASSTGANRNVDAGTERGHVSPVVWSLQIFPTSAGQVAAADGYLGSALQPGFPETGARTPPPLHNRSF